MIESIILAVNVVLPIFCLILIGYAVQRFNVIGRDAFIEINKLVFVLFLPLVLFQSIYHTDLRVSFNLELILFALAGLVAVMLASMLAVKYVDDDPRKKGVMVQAMYRSNFILFGLPIVSSLYSDIGVTSIIISFIVPFQAIFSVIVLEYYHGGKFDLFNTVKKLLSNPMMIGTALALLMMAFHITLPTFADKVIANLSGVATPLALLVLGGTFQFQELHKNTKHITVAVLARLVIAPSIILSLAVLLGYRGIELVTLMVLFASPVAVSSYSMAMVMDGDSELASQLVLVSTMFSIVSVCAWVFLLQYMNFL